MHLKMFAKYTANGLFCTPNDKVGNKVKVTTTNFVLMQLCVVKNCYDLGVTKLPSCVKQQVFNS